MNLKQETLKHIGNKKVDYIKIDYDGKTIEGRLPDIVDSLDFEYEDSFGIQMIIGFIWYEDGTWSERVEYDDAESWRYVKRPTHPLYPGITRHPRNIKIGDVIDWDVRGINRATVQEISFTPDADNVPDYHVSGRYSFKTGYGHINSRVNGRHITDSPIYVFPNP